MPLSFFTKPQQMTFVDSSGNAISAWNLQGGHMYDVYFYIQNDTNSQVSAELSVTHGRFGIGGQSETSYLTQPATPVTVPPNGIGGGLGLRIVCFQYTPPANDFHCCIVAKMSWSGGILVLNQNTQSVGAQENRADSFPFLIYNEGTAGRNIELKLTEWLYVDDNDVTPITSTDSWLPQSQSPQFSDVFDILGSLTSAPPTLSVSPTREFVLTLNNFSGSVWFGLKVKAAMGSQNAHIFKIVGKDLNPALSDPDNYLGEVDFKVDPLPPSSIGTPDVYVRASDGQTVSPDIALYDLNTNPNTEITPNGFPDRIVVPNTQYGFAAIVHNSGDAVAVNTVVRFWEASDGLSINENLLDIQVVDVPAKSNTTDGFIEVRSAATFLSAPDKFNACAIISVFNPQSAAPCNQDATTLPWPGNDPNHACAAWLNTKSEYASPGVTFTINLGVAYPEFGPGPVETTVIAQRLKKDWKDNERVQDMSATLEQAGQRSRIPIFLMPRLSDVFDAVDLNIKAKSRKGIKVIKTDKAKDKGSTCHVYNLQIPKGDKPTPFIVTGKIPEDAKPGEVFIVNFSANYAKTKVSRAKTVKFIQLFYIKK